MVYRIIGIHVIYRVFSWISLRMSCTEVSAYDFVYSGAGLFTFMQMDSLFWTIFNVFSFVIQSVKILSRFLYVLLMRLMVAVIGVHLFWGVIDRLTAEYTLSVYGHNIHCHLQPLHVIITQNKDIAGCTIIMLVFNMMWFYLFGSLCQMKYSIM